MKFPFGEVKFSLRECDGMCGNRKTHQKSLTLDRFVIKQREIERVLPIDGQSPNMLQDVTALGGAGAVTSFLYSGGGFFARMS